MIPATLRVSLIIAVACYFIRESPYHQNQRGQIEEQRHQMAQQVNRFDLKKYGTDKRLRKQHKRMIKKSTEVCFQ